MMKFRKALSLLLSSVLVTSTLIISVVAADNNDDTTEFHSETDVVIDYYNVDSSAISRIEPKASKDYNVYSDKFYIMRNNIGVGCEGWTNLTYKSDGSYVYHYTEACAWVSGDPYYSEKEWGRGKIWASTGDIGHGAISAISIYYGIS